MQHWNVMWLDPVWYLVLLTVLWGYGVWKHSWRYCIHTEKWSATPHPLSLFQCNRLDLGVELLGLSVSGCGGGDTVQLLVHSHQDISIWNLSQVSLPPQSCWSLHCLCQQLETHFASVYSNTVALSRVESPDSARIMATAEVELSTFLTCVVLMLVLLHRMAVWDWYLQRPEK